MQEKKILLELLTRHYTQKHGASKSIHSDGIELSGEREGSACGRGTGWGVAYDDQSC